MNGTYKWLSIIALLSAQIVGVIWWAASAADDLRDLIGRVSRMEVLLDQNREALIRLATEERDIQKRLDRSHEGQ